MNQFFREGLVHGGNRYDWISRCRLPLCKSTRIHSRAISTEIAERLRLILASERSELPNSLKNLVSRLPELDENSPSIVP